jgi:hypothetical protein
MADERGQLRRCPANGQRAWGLGRLHAATDQRTVQRIGDHGQIGQFRHGSAIVVARNRVLDSPGPERQDS